jgi:hypothetical protein
MDECFARAFDALRVSQKMFDMSNPSQSIRCSRQSKSGNVSPLSRLRIVSLLTYKEYCEDRQRSLASFSLDGIF